MITTWLDIEPDSPFPVENLPFGSFSTDSTGRRLGVALGSCVLDLAALADRGLVPNDDGALDAPTLNPLFARGRSGWVELRERLVEIVGSQRYEDVVRPLLVPTDQARMHLPFEVGDYVDFYSFRHHAENLGRILRPGGEPLTANWRSIPIGYHGRSGTVSVSGTPVTRPLGQRKGPEDEAPSFGPSLKLDFEAEVGFVVGTGSALGSPLCPEDFAGHVFGAVLVNDWSARDLQAWEYVPLGPFLGKSFLTSISPWVVTLDALAQARVPPMAQDPAPLGYLVDPDPWALDIELEVSLNDKVISRPPFREMYWSPGQQLAHMTSNGANVRPGDLFASGTVSGAEADQWGSLMEISWNGTRPVAVEGGVGDGFLADGDSVTITARALCDGGVRIGFGTVAGTVVGCGPD